MSTSIPYATRRTRHAPSRPSRCSVHKRVPGSSTSATVVPWRGDIAVAGAHLVIGATDAHADAVIPPVAPVGRRVPEEILAVQFFGDPRRRVGELLAAVHDLGAAAAVIGDFPQ